MVNGFTVRLPAIAAIPDRVAEPGRTIRAARAAADLRQHQGPSSERSTAVAVREVKALLDKAAPDSPALPAHVPPERFRRIAGRPSSTIPTCCMPTAAT